MLSDKEDPLGQSLLPIAYRLLLFVLQTRATLRSVMRMVVRLWLIKLVLLSGLSLFAQDFTGPAQQLVARISERVPPTSAAITFKDISSIGPTNASLVRSTLLRGLQARGWKTLEGGQGEVSIGITLAENYRDYVWTAEIIKAPSREVAILEFARPQPQAKIGAQISLTRTLLISSEQPLLDASLLEGRINEGGHLLALTSTAIRVYLLQSSQWRMLQEYQFNHTFSTRDLQGRLLSSGNNFDAFLPGMHCSGTVGVALAANCVATDDPWPISDDRRVLAFYAANRNYFNGVISGANGQSVVNPFYSAATLGDTVIYSGLDGHTLISQNGHRPVLLSLGWGNNVDAVQSVCQSDLILATGTGDFNQSDAVTAFRATNLEFSPASDAVLFAGPVTGLKATADHQQAIAISSSAGRYEAYLLTPRCGA